MQTKTKLERLWGFLLPPGANFYSREALVAGYLYLARTGQREGHKPICVHAQFLCPCGCGHLVTLDLLPKCPGGWKFELHPLLASEMLPRVTLTPDIDLVRSAVFTGGAVCRSHFSVTNSEIVWC